MDLPIGPQPLPLGSELSPMRPTEVFSTPLDDVHPGLRLVETFHRPVKDIHPDPSYEALWGIKGEPGKTFSDGKHSFRTRLNA